MNQADSIIEDELNVIYDLNQKSLVSKMNKNFDKALENLDQLKQQNLVIFREMFLNEQSSAEESSVELSRDVS